MSVGAICLFGVEMKTVISIKVETEVKDKLREQAEKEGMSFNQMMEQVLGMLISLSGEATMYEYIKEIAEFEGIMSS